jgi:hypothetical protein
MPIESVKNDKPIWEKHYTPAELAELWGFSDEFVRKLFRGQDGVVVVNRPEKMHKRGYVTLRIPKSVAERVYAQQLVAKRPTSIAALPPAEARRLA